MNALETLLHELEHDPLLDRADRLRRRIDALDRLETFLLHAPDPAHEVAITKATLLHDRASAVQAKLDAINDRLYQAIRSEIRQGTMPCSLLEHLIGCSRDEDAASRMHEEGYDALDVVVSGVLPFEAPAFDIAELAAEMVFYQPTPARHIVDLIERAALTERDVLIDLGSGLGHVPLLTSLCTGARSIGIEREAAYVDCARKCAQALNLSNVTFLQQDAREADLSRGTVFYLYTPFTGAILRTVLDSLQREATGRNLRVCTYGPCTSIVANEPWLEVVGTLKAGRLALFRSLAIGTRG